MEIPQRQAEPGHRRLAVGSRTFRCIGFDETIDLRRQRGDIPVPG